MGQAPSTSKRRRASDRSTSAEAPLIVTHNGVRLTPALAERLALEQAGGDVLAAHLAPADKNIASDIRAATALASHVNRDIQVAAEKMISKSESLSKALETSRLVNDLLLAREEEELSKVDKLSREILEREGEKYGVDVEKEAEAGVCGVEEGLVLGCYREHAGNGEELACRGLVDAYTRCAFGVHK